MRGRLRLVALAVGALTVAGAGAGAVAATQSDGDPSASGLSLALPDEVLQDVADGPGMFGGPGHHFGEPGTFVDIMAPVADLLKLDEAALRDRLETGDTLADVAADQSVSKESLVAGIAAALKAAKPGGAPEHTDAEITEMATKIADGSGPCIGGGERGPGGEPGGAADTPAAPVPAIPSV